MKDVVLIHSYMYFILCNNILFVSFYTSPTQNMCDYIQYDAAQHIRLYN